MLKKINDQYELESEFILDQNFILESELYFNKWKGKDNVINLVIKKR